ncbi:MAG: hypothetical protein ABII81_02375 [Pseudomonadota bacterium]
MLKIVLVVSFSVLISACFSMPPRADAWTFWKKEGVTKREAVERAMLECGYSMGADRAVSDELRRNYEKYLKESVFFYRCMEKDGFRYTSELGTACEEAPNLPECKLPIEQIPSRDIGRRLNGVYCTKFPTSELCKP